MKPTTLAFAALLPGSLPLLAADEPGRPHLLGLSHIALYAHELDRTRAFYRDFLGFAEPYSLTNKDGTLAIVWVKINDHQSIELYPEKLHSSALTNSSER